MLESFKQKEEPLIVVKRSSEVSPEVKANPFYDPEIWARAQSFDDILLPDSDEALSFAWAAHEIGHLVKYGAREDASLNNFIATRAEEERAWENGWPYLKRYLEEYYHGDQNLISRIEDAYTKIKILAMQAVDLSQEMYLPLVLPARGESVDLWFNT